MGRAASTVTPMARSFSANTRSVDAGADSLAALVDRIRDHLDATARATGRQLLFDDAHLPPKLNQPLPPTVRQHVYLIFKEAVTNVLVHAPQATKLAVTLTHYAVASDLVLTIEDDGHPATAPGRSGVGLRTMLLRASALRGTLEAGPRREGGFRVQLQVPFK